MNWHETSISSIRMKVIDQDGQGRTATLFKMEPGAIVPLHDHTAIEQAYVLASSLEDDEGTCGAADFVRRPGGDIAHTSKGALTRSIFYKPDRFIDGLELFASETKN